VTAGPDPRCLDWCEHAPGRPHRVTHIVLPNGSRAAAADGPVVGAMSVAAIHTWRQVIWTDT
jgi:hypothetical protein